jgi:hypothetical protein
LTASNVFVAHSKPRNSWGDLAIIKYLSNGAQDWIIQYPGNGNGFHYPSKIILDDSRNIFVAGTGYGQGLYDFLTLKYSQVIGVEPISNVIPKSFLLFQNFPNPFNNTTNILFDIPNSVHVNITIYNLLGQKIETLADRFLMAGTYKIDWNAELVSSGVYFCKLIANNNQYTIKLSLIK